MLKRIRTITLTAFATLALVGHHQGIFAAATVRNECPSVCYLIGFDCTGSTNCTEVTDQFCSSLCQAFSGSECPYTYGEGYRAGCQQGQGFSCACTGAG